VVLANGCFDLIHAGHIRYLKECKKKGDILVVALNSDSSVRQLKGAGRPILLEQERAEIISSFYFVDYVTFFGQKKVDKVLLALKPQVHAKGSDYSVDTVPERETVKRYGGEIAITGGPKIKSTSEVIEEIAERFKNFGNDDSS
jgi:rfaE bifunctional protein nucleotidyltransferase chain/domain